MPTILISGAASGIGKAFVEHYASYSTNEIIAIDISPITLRSNYAADIKTFRVDVSSPESVSSLASSLSSKHIDIIIHSAGIRGLVPSIHKAYPEDVARAETLDNMDVETMLRTYQINTIGTFTLIRILLPNLRLASSQGQTQPKVIIMGSRMGSVSYNSTGGGYAYRASKAALNAIIKSLSIDVPDVCFLSMHPGRVETGLVLSKEEGAITPEESLADMIRAIEKLGKEDSGRFVDRWGKDIGW